MYIIKKSTNQQILGKLVVFFSSLYEHQIALKVILLSIKIDMYGRKQIKT